MNTFLSFSLCYFLFSTHLRELQKLSSTISIFSISTGREEVTVEQLIGKHFKKILKTIIKTSKRKTTNKSDPHVLNSNNISSVINHNSSNDDDDDDVKTKDINLDWSPNCCAKAVFEILVRESPHKAWHYHQNILGEGMDYFVCLSVCVCVCVCVCVYLHQ